MDSCHLTSPDPSNHHTVGTPAPSGLLERSAPSVLAAWKTVSYWLRALWGAVSMVGRWVRY